MIMMAIIYWLIRVAHRRRTIYHSWGGGGESFFILKKAIQEMEIRKNNPALINSDQAKKGETQTF